MVAAGQRWSALVDSPADLRELTVRTFLRTTQAPDLAVRAGLERMPEELRTVVAAYDRLPKLQRAVLMLITSKTSPTQRSLESLTGRLHGFASNSTAGSLPSAWTPTRCGPHWTSPAGIRLQPRTSPGLSGGTPRRGPGGDAGSGWPESRSERWRRSCCRSALSTGRP